MAQTLSPLSPPEGSRQHLVGSVLPFLPPSLLEVLEPQCSQLPLGK